MNRSLIGRTALVTGGTDGIGKEIARGLAARGARLIVVGSNSDKGRLVERELRDGAGHDNVHFLQADLSLMREVNRLAGAIEARCGRLHYLVHSAGIVRGRHTLTAEGVESNFAAGYLSRFALTGRLLGLLERSGEAGAAARILFISGAARGGKIHYEDVNLTRNFGLLRMIWQLCEANDVFVVEQARRLAEAGLDSRVIISALKVGVVRTNIRREFPFWMRALATLVFDPFLAQTAMAVAENALRLLVSPEFENASGELFVQIKRFKHVTPEARTSDPAEGHRLWDLSLRLADPVRYLRSSA
ncbi:MAG TPA: SDR family NAD(P)-dependent oxidoreductase [Bryobacteraceae bacterium]|nr:SDR family NAD(P)-dependent oxidoreductase [Bryobacteraceae bacterium]